MSGTFRKPISPPFAPPPITESKETPADDFGTQNEEKSILEQRKSLGFGDEVNEVYAKSDYDSEEEYQFK